MSHGYLQGTGIDALLWELLHRSLEPRTASMDIEPMRIDAYVYYRAVRLGYVIGLTVVVQP
jgi:hypothetical protein